jgi:hypothetical protein
MSEIHSAGPYRESAPTLCSGCPGMDGDDSGRRDGSRTTFLSPVASCRWASLTMSVSRYPNRAACSSRMERTSATTGSESIVDLQQFLWRADHRRLEPHSTTDPVVSPPFAGGLPVSGDTENSARLHGEVADNRRFKVNARRHISPCVPSVRTIISSSTTAMSPPSGKRPSSRKSGIALTGSPWVAIVNSCIHFRATRRQAPWGELAISPSAPHSPNPVLSAPFIPRGADL